MSAVLFKKHANIVVAVAVLGAISCSKNKDGSHIAASGSSRIGASAAAENSIAQIPTQVGVVQIATPPASVTTSIPLVIPSIPSHLKGLTLLPSELKSKAGNDVLIGWVLPSDIDNAANFTLRIFDNAKNLILERSAPASDFAITGGFGTIWKTPTSEGFYEIEVMGEAADGRIIDSTTGNIVVRDTPPQLRIYLGLQEQPDNCTAATYSPVVVAASSLPFSFCAKEPETLDANGKDISIGIAKFCFKKFSPKEAPLDYPLDNDPCWTEKTSVPASILLQTGVNEIIGFVKDNLGNIGSEKASVILEQGDAPRVDIMEPLSTELSSMVWKYTTETPIVKKFRWRATHKTTAFKDMRFIVTLMESADQSKFKHLACSFKNDPVFKQCPSAEIENSPLIKTVITYPTYPSGINSQGQGEGEAEFLFTIPPDWDSKKTYLLMVTGIDRAGNAAVASTQEINSGWEVLAGRTYDGLGSSGKNLRRSMQVSIIRTDKFGQLFDITNNIKFSALDNRSCRLVRGINAAPTPFDCEDIIETNEKIINTEWAYSVDEHAFYTISFDKKIVRINLKNRNTEVLLGEGSSLLSKDLPSQSVGRDFKISSNYSGALWSYYEKHNKLLFFMADNMLFSLDKNGKINHILGNGVGADIPVSQLNVPQKDLILPNGIIRFAVTSDNRILLGTAKLPLGWPGYDGRGVQYILHDFSLTNNATVVNFERYSIEAILPRDPNTACIRQGITVDEKNENLYATLSWWGFYRDIVKCCG